MILRSTDEAAAPALEHGRVYGLNAVLGNAQVVQVAGPASDSWTDTIGVDSAGG